MQNELNCCFQGLTVQAEGILVRDEDRYIRLVINRWKR